MSTFIGTVRVSFAHDDCYVIEVGTSGKLYLPYRSQAERDKAFNQQQLNDIWTAFQRVATSAGLVWPANA
jgi:hypothetical protein